MNSDESQHFKIKKRIHSFKYAFNGFQILIKTQHNSWIHVVTSALVIIAGILFEVNNLEWGLLFAAIGLVITAEIFNTAFEYMVDWISPEQQKKAGQVKDLAAAGVLFSAIISVVIGILVFGPKLLSAL